MRFRLVTVAILLAVASRGDGRPRDPDPLDSSSSSSQEVMAASLGGANRSGSPDSRPHQHRETKDIQNMDQSLRTVATQLLNATAKRDDLVRIPEEKIVTIETPMQVVHISTRVEDAVSELNSASEDESSKMKFGIPVNSKFGHFEMSNPGHAMALTEEEIEREMATATTAGQKHQPTTASMLSTWIQLYPPATTTENNNEVKIEVKNDIQSNQIPSTTSTKLPTIIVKQTTTNTKPNRKTETKQTTVPVDKSTEPSISTTKAVKNSSSSATSNFVKISTTLSPTSLENDVDETQSIEKKPQNHRTTASMSTKSTATTKKPAKSTTIKPKITTLKNSTTKPPKGNNSGNRLKPFPTRRPAGNKNENVTSTSKIEKVTLKPTTTSPQNRTESTEKPLFITKIKASILTEAQKQPTTTTTTTKPVPTIISKMNFSNTESANTKVPSPTKVNNVLKVHLKKPIDDTTKIEIQPIRVNPPVLTIEKIEDTSLDQKIDKENQEIMQNSKIDVKFDFNPEYSNDEVQTSSTESTSLSTTTTKRRRPSNKRKKNKNRRRNKTTTTTTTLATPTNPSVDDDDTITLTSLDDALGLTDLQESKIEPESKTPPKKKKPNQNTQVQKPIGTQIYNFLSREVMPSVGVMSLVGLGLGLASYFLYPFGGVITRRNYEVEPNYKYNMDEYGGNYGLSEEEVLSKVYSGMTGGQHHETKYNTASPSGEKNPNYYRYAGAEQPQQRQQQQPTKYPTTVTKNQGNRILYRPVGTTSYDLNYRNTEFKYPDVPTTPNYYERQRQKQHSPDFMSTIGKVELGNNRQFVVGNIPKEYASEEVDKTPPVQDMLPISDKIDQNVQYQADESYAEENSPVSPLTAPELETLGNPAALVSKVDEEQPAGVYEEIEITPTAVAVEHGPRSLKTINDDSKILIDNPKLIRRRRSILPDIAGSFLPLTLPRFKTSRIERSSVIQVIPSKSEIEKEKKEEAEEEDLSNEILDIIDDALPGKSDKHKNRYDVLAGSASSTKQHTVMNSVKDNMSTSTTTTANSASRSSTTTSTTTVSDDTAKQAPSSTTTTTTTETPTEPDFTDLGETTLDWQENLPTTAKPSPPTSNAMNIFDIAKKIAQVKLRLGLTILRHASEGFARYISHIQKRFNGEE